MQITLLGCSEGKTKMRIHSNFVSLAGEVNGFHQGSLVHFIRFQGCNLSCSYCDTKDSINAYKGTNITRIQLLGLISRQKSLKNICLTGGEPLLQVEEWEAIVQGLWMEGYRFTVETNGTVHIPFSVFPYVYSWVIDCKRNWAFAPPLKNLRKTDFIKFVVGSYQEYIQVIEKINDFRVINSEVKFAISPIHEKLNPSQVANWIIEDKLDVILNVQLHKTLNIK